MAAGSITFELLMKTAQFSTDTARAEKRIKELKKEAEALGKALGAAVVAGVTAMTFALKQSIDAMDDLSKSAQKVGTTTEALSALQYAASLADVSTEELTLSMGKLAKSAADGNEAFAAMGIKTTDTAGNLKDTSQLMTEVAGKFAAYKDGAEKTALAQEIFGKSGAKLIPLLNSGADGLAEMADEAERLGLIVSGDTGKAAEEFNDTLTRLGAVGRGVANQMAAELLPTLQTVSDYLLENSKDSGVLAAAFSGLKLAFQAAVVIGSDVAFVFKMVGGEIGVIAAQVATLARGDLSGAKLLGEEWTKEAAKARADLDAFQAKVVGAASAVQELGRQGGATAADWGQKFSAPLVKSAKDAETARKKIESEAEKARKALEAEGARLTESVMTPAERRSQSIGTAQRLGDAGVISPETQRRAVAEAESVYQEYVARQRELLTEGLLTEEQEIAASYERRRQMIMAMTEATETEKQSAIAALSEQQEQKIAAARIARYKDLMTQEQQLTVDYTQRRRQIEDDDSVSAEQKTAYLLKLSEDYHASMQKLDEEDQAKRDELSKKQIELVETGFSSMADLAKAFAGEQSNTYKALFAVSKAFAIADITIKQSQAIAKAWGENNYWVAAGLTVGLAAQFAGLISSAQSASFGGTRADGGPVSEGRSYLVGERGPEMFTPSEGGRIVPNDALGSQQQAQPIRIVNAFDDGHIDDYLGSDSGERKIINAVRRNKRALGIA